MEKHTNGFKWTFQNIAGMKMVFEWILEVRSDSQGKDCVECKTKESEFVQKSKCFMKYQWQKYKKIYHSSGFLQTYPFFPPINFTGVEVGDFTSV